MEDYKNIECHEHGEQQATFVCKHLIESLQTNIKVGYHCAVNDPGNSRPDAWCAKCEEKRIECGGDWMDESTDFAGVTLLCGACYDIAKMINHTDDIQNN